MVNSNPGIIIVTHEFFPQIGGIATYVREMAQALHDLGKSVEVWGPQGAGKGEEFAYPVVEMPGKGNQDWRELRKLHKYLRQQKGMLENKILWIAEPAPIRALALFGFQWLPQSCRVWVNLMGSELAQFKSNPFWRWRVGKLFDRTEKISFISKVILADYLSWRESGKSTLTMTRCALRSDFQIQKVQESLPRDKKVILTISRIHPRKGQALVIEALNKLPRALQEQVEYWIVGDGRREYRRKLEVLAEKSAVPVLFKGRLNGEELGEVYASGDIFILTSLPDPKSVESFGMVYLEAAAYGKPVIAARVGGVHEAVDEGRTGVLVEPRNIDEIAKAIVTMLETPELIRTMGENGRLWVKNFSWKASAEELLRS